MMAQTEAQPETESQSEDNRGADYCPDDELRPTATPLGLFLIERRSHGDCSRGSGAVNSFVGTGRRELTEGTAVRERVDPLRAIN